MESLILSPSPFEPSLKLLVDIRIAKETEIRPSPGDNSQSTSAISSGPQLKALSRSSEMIYCTWLYIIMALVIIYDSFLLLFFSSFFPLHFLLACLWRRCTARCRFSLYAFPAAAKALCSRTTAALPRFGLWAVNVLAVEFAAPSQRMDIRLNRPFGASLWHLLSF